MGNYLTYSATTNDLERYLTANALANILSDIGPDSSKLAAVNDAIDASESEVDSYLGRRYTVPLSSPPEVVVDAAGALTVERLYLRGHGAPDKVSDRAAQVRDWLRDISKGAAALPDQPAIPTEDTGSGVVTVEAEDRELTRDNLGFW